MLRTAKLINTPSIQNIILQDQTTKLNNEIKQLFKPQQYPTFPLQDLIMLPNYTSDQRFYMLVKELEDWNKKVEQGLLKKQLKAELCRNKFLFSSLKNLVISGSKGTVNYQTNINKLFEWFQKNNREQMPLYFTVRKKTRQDEDWQVRKTFKSNMPLELRNYQRRALFTTQQDLSYLHPTRTKQNSQQKLVDYSAIKQYNSKQLRKRQGRGEQEIEICKTLLKSKKSRFLQNNSHNPQFYQGGFNLASKTITYFGRKSDKSVFGQKFRDKISASFSIKEKDELQKIKKYRFNSTLNKKGPLFQQRDTNFNKTAKTFFSTKPFDATVSDFGQTITNRNLGMMKQMSIKIDQIPSSKTQPIDKEQKQNTLKEFSQFMELRNWEGERLLSNPFEKKKQLKKKKKK